MFTQVMPINRNSRCNSLSFKSKIIDLNQNITSILSSKFETFFALLSKPSLTWRSLICLLSLLPGCDQREPKKIVAVTQIVSHPAADAVTQGLKDGLKAAGYVDGKNITWIFENAEGNIIKSKQIAQKFVNRHPDVIIPITTPSTQAIVSAARNTDIPIIFSAVTDPINANIITDMNYPGGYITGITDRPPISDQLALIQEIIPNLAMLGVLYDPNETTAAQVAQQVDDLSREMGFRVIKLPISKVEDIASIFQKAASEIDAIYIPPDNTILSAIKEVVSLSYQYSMPIFSSDSHSVSQGAIAMVGFSHYETGRKTAEMVVRLFKGEKPGNMRVASPSTTDIYLNLQSADRLGILLANSLVQKAKHVFQ